MKPKTLMLMGVAIAFGLLAAFLTARFAGNPPPPEYVQVPVAKAEIKQGIPLKWKDDEELKKKDFFEKIQYIKGQEPQGFLKEEEIRDKYTVRKMPARAFFTKDDLAENKNLDPEPGFMAMAIQASVDRAAGGFVLPSSRVDVIAILSSKSGGRYARRILRNILVLAVDQFEVTPGDKRALPPQSITLQVTPKDALRLGWAKSQGELQLALRPRDDGTAPKDTDTEDSDIFEDPASEEKKAREAVKVWVAKDDIEAGTRVTDVEALFREKPFDKTSAPENALGKDVLQGKTITKYVPRDGFVTAKHVEGKIEGPPMPAGPPVKRETLTIIQGPATRVVEYYDGVAGSRPPDQPREVTPAPSPLPPPKPAPGGSEGK